MAKRFALLLGALTSASLVANPAIAQSRGLKEGGDRMVAASREDARTQFDLGWRFFEGKEVPQNYPEALRWFQLSAEQGFAAAQTILGVMYLDGQGVTADSATAAIWLRKAADQGDASAQYIIGLLYYNGNGVTQSYAEAENWLREATSKGHKKARKSLHSMQVGCLTAKNPTLWKNISSCMTMDEVSSALLEHGIRTRSGKLKDGSACPNVKDRAEIAGLRMELSLWCSAGKIQGLTFRNTQSPDGIFVKFVSELSQFKIISRALSQIYGNPVEKSALPEKVSSNSAASIYQEFSIFRTNEVEVSLTENILLGVTMPSSRTIILNYRSIAVAEFEKEAFERRARAEQEERDRRAREGL